MKPIMFQDFVASEDLRREAWTRAFSGVARWVGAEPNAGPQAVARLVEQGKVTHVVTQNVDNLHQASGVPAQRVIELHGNASYATCLDCDLRHELEVLKHNSDANLLWCVLKSAHGARKEPFAIASKAMSAANVISGWVWSEFH